MAIRLSCPGCHAALNVAENLVGKTIKCKTCGEMIPVSAPVKAAVAKVARAAPREDDDEFDSPRPERRTDGSKLPMLIAVAAGVVVLLGGGMGLAYFFMGDKKNEIPVASNDAPPKLIVGMSSSSGAPKSAPDEPKIDVSKLDETKKGEPKKIETAEKKSDEPATVETKVTAKASDADGPKVGTPAPKPEDTPKAAPPVSAPAGQSSEDWTRKMMSGELDDITRAQCKHATVLIECLDKFGGGGHGSGWFGIEQNIVITNAHVLGMLSPNSPLPAKITIFVNSGEYGQNPGIAQREIPHQRIKILGVDRFHDIAILEISGEKDLPSPFKVRPSAKLKERQGITVLGFPLGLSTARSTGSKKQPTISVRPSTVTALRYDDFGILRNVQIEGGTNHGNSGGPQVDAEGNVIGMTVAGLLDDGNLSQVCLSVPTEHIQGILAGRVDKVTLDTAYNEGGTVHIPVTVTAQDPMKRLKAIGLGCWVGESTTGIRPPGETRKGIVNSDKDYKEMTLKYDAVTKTATGEIVLPPLTPGQSYWFQPYYSNTITPKYYMAGIKVELSGPPVDKVPTSLTLNIRPNQVRPFTLTSKTAETDFVEGEDNGDLNDALKYVITMKGTETVMAPDSTDTQNAARLRLKYDDCDLGGEGGNREGKLLPPRILLQLKTGIKSLEAFAYVNRSGGIYKTRTNTLGVQDQLTKVLGPPMSTIALGALQECSIPLPNKEVQPGETWGGSRTIAYALSFIENVRKSAQDGQPQPPGGRPRPGGAAGTTVPREVGKRDYLFNQEIKFTYQGTRLRGGRKEAVIRYDGKITPAAGKAGDSISGVTKGYAFVDISTGVVMDAEIESEKDLDTSLEGLKRRTYSMNKYTLTRGSNVK